MTEVEDHWSAQEKLWRTCHAISQFTRHGFGIEPLQAQIGDTDLAKLEFSCRLEFLRGFRHLFCLAPTRLHHALTGFELTSLSQPWLVGELSRAGFQVGIAHELVAAQGLCEQADRSTNAGHELLPDFVEPIGAVKQHRNIIARLKEYLAGQQWYAQLRVAGHVAIENPSKAKSTVGLGDDNPVDVGKFRVSLAEPDEIRAFVAGKFAQRDQEPGDDAIHFSDPEVGRVVEEPAHARRIQGQDAGTDGVVEGEHGIELVLTHVANNDGHA